MLRLALAALLLPFALAGCESTPEPDDLASRLDARYAEGLGTLESFHVYAAGTSLYYIGAEDSTGARTFELTPDPDAVAPRDPMAASLLRFYPPNPRYLASRIDPASVRGPVEREGAQTVVFESETPQDAGFVPVPGTTNHLVRVYFDAETLDVRELFHRFSVDSLERPVAQRLLYDDFREVADGVRLPFRVTQIQEGPIPSSEAATVQGAQLAIREQRARLLPPSVGRQQELIDIARAKRLLTEGVREVQLRVDSVLTNVPAPTPALPAE